MSRSIFIFLFLALIGLLVVSNIYLSHRFAWFFSLESAGWLYAGFAVITVFMIGGLVAFSNSSKLIGSIGYRTAALLMGFMLFLLFSTLVVDLFHFAVKLQPLYYGLLALGLALMVSVYGFWNGTNIKVKQIEIPVNRLIKEIRAMHLTDIHIGHFRGRAFLQDIVNKTNKLKPDVIFITGDLFDGKFRLNQECLEPLKQLNAPIYFVEGNHDKYTGVETIKQYLRNISVRVLEDEVVQWNDLQIIGLNHMLADHNSIDMHGAGEGPTIQKVLDTLDIAESKASILLHHSPDGIKYANEQGVDLYLAGHTHAGQLFPINFLNELLFAYNKGIHDFNGTQIYVSHGAGTFGPPMRVGTRSEITLLTLVPV